jgi:hypothetical protein
MPAVQCAAQALQLRLHLAQSLVDEPQSAVIGREFLQNISVKNEDRQDRLAAAEGVVEARVIVET